MVSLPHVYVLIAQFLMHVGFDHSAAWQQIFGTLLLMSRPSDIAIGTMAHSLVVLLSNLSQEILSPTVDTGGALGIFITACPILQAHSDAARTMWKIRQAVYSASSRFG